MKKKIAIFGTYPPPIGGTSIHVKRLSLLLSNEYDVTVYDTYGSGECNENVISIKNYKKFLLAYFFNGKDDIIHSHTHSWNERLILSIIAKLKRKKIIFTYHSLREQWSEKVLLNKVVCRLVFLLSDMNIVPDELIKNELVSWGLKVDKVKIIPTFLLPNLNKINKCDKKKDFKIDKEIIICANASNTNKYKGQDLYGIDMCIDLCHKLNKDFNVKFIFALTRITDKAYYMDLNRMIEYYNLKDKFKIIISDKSFLPIINEADIFIRPTNTDSFGISVAEAIALNTPAVASNVCKRAEGTILFENRDCNDLYNKVKKVINNYDVYKNTLKNIKNKDYSSEILNLYKELLK